MIPAGADPDSGGTPGNVAYQHGGRGAGYAHHVMMLGQPEAGESPLFGVLRQVESIPERFGYRAALTDRSEIENREARIHSDLLWICFNSPGRRRKSRYRRQL